VLWIVLALMCLLAAGFAILPLVRGLSAKPVPAIVVIGFVIMFSAWLYYLKGSPEVPSGASKEPDVGAMVASLEQRLEQQPDDLNGWKMLGRSYMTLGNFQAAVAAYEKAVALEDGQVGRTLLDLGIALAQAGGEQLSPRAIATIENAFALEPNDPDAMFWGGIAAINRGDASLAADRWEKLLEIDPPESVRTVLVERIAAWRGEPVATTGAETMQGAPETTGPVVSIAVTLSETAKAALPADASVFVIARDPAQPSPPVAVTRRTLAELPTEIELGDGDAMIPGRNLSAFARIELVVRASASGQPIAAPGDWFGSAIVVPKENNTVSIEIGDVVN
jgi:cytochrome c-type biogenesis protein CcmH